MSLTKYQFVRERISYFNADEAVKICETCIILSFFRVKMKVLLGRDAELRVLLDQPVPHRHRTWLWECLNICSDRYGLSTVVKLDILQAAATSKGSSMAGVGKA